MALQNSWPGPSGLTTTTAARKNLAGLLETDTSGNPRVGVFASNPNAIVTARADMNVDIAAFQGVTVQFGGPILLSNDGTMQLPSVLVSPGAGTNYYVIYVKQNESTSPGTDSNNSVLAGAALSTTSFAAARAALPMGALELATVQMPTGKTATNEASVTITQTFVYTAAEGGCVPVRNATELAAWAPANGAEAFRLDTGLMYVRSGDAWGLSRGYDRKTFAGATDGSGLVTVNHGLGVSPTVVIVTDQNSGAVPNTRKIVRSATSSTQIQFYVTNGGNALVGNPVVFDWVAFL